MEKEVQTLKYEKGMSFPEARKLVKSRTPRNGVSYSSAVLTTPKPVLKSMGTQTDTLTPAIHNSTTSIGKPNTNITEKSFNMPVGRLPTINVNKKSKIIDSAPRKNNKNAASNSNPTNWKTTVKKPPPPKLPGSTSQPNKPSKILKRTDFLKNPPPDKNIPKTDDSLKVYVSAEEDMLTDDASDCGSDRLSSAAC
jgi:hypothetical protein